MKNIKNLRDLEDLPIETLSFRLKGKHQLEEWNTRYRKSDHHSPIKGFRQIWRYIDWFLKKRIGKPFDDVFSEFCKIVPKYSQKFFLDQLDIKNPKGYIYWYVDDEGLIRHNDRFAKNKNLTYQSDDFKQEFRHKKTNILGHPDTLKNRKETDSQTRWRYRCLHKGCDHNNCSHRFEDYHYVTVSGWSKTFDRWNDPEFKKLRSIRHRKQINNIRKKRNARRKSVDFHILIERFKEKRDANIITLEQREKWRLIDEENRQRRLKREEEANLIKIISHGFDPVNSFRHKKQY